MDQIPDDLLDRPSRFDPVAGQPQIGVPGEILIFVTVAASKHSHSPKSKELRLRMSLSLARKARLSATRRLHSYDCGALFNQSSNSATSPVAIAIEVSAAP